MRSFNDAEWEQIEHLRQQVDALRAATSLEAAAQGFVGLFVNNFESVVLARTFVVVPFSNLPAEEQRAARNAGGDLSPTTPVLTLLATRGKDPTWNDRKASLDHRCIPLLSSAAVADAPMVAKLLSDLNVDLKPLDDGRPIATRRMLGGKNGTFYVEDAALARDARGRYIISSREFATKHDVHTVFGMGGAYLDGMLVVAVLFCSEVLARFTVDRFPTFIGSFKIATASLVAQNRLFRSEEAQR
jgi:hypothetical protein